MNGLEVVPDRDRCSCVIPLSWGERTAVIGAASSEKRLGGVHILHDAVTESVCAKHMDALSRVTSALIAFSSFSTLSPPMHEDQSVLVKTLCY